MPFGISTGTAILGGAAIAGGASLLGGAMQADAVNSSSKSAIRVAQENAIRESARTGAIIGAVGPRIEGGGQSANAALTNWGGAADTALSTGYGNARNDLMGYSDAAAGWLKSGQAEATNLLNGGYDAAGQRLQQAGDAARGYLNTGRDTIGAGVDNANRLLDPYIKQGGRALNVVGDLSGANGVDAGRAAMANFEASPAYQFNLDQGLRAIDAGAAARGMLVSGGTRQAEQKFGAGLASNEFGNYYNRLSALAGQGLTAGTTAGNNIMTGSGRQAEFDRGLASNEQWMGGALATNDANRGTQLSNLTTNLATGMAANRTQLGTNLGNLDTGLGTALSNNAMTTGGRLSSNELQTAGNILNLYSGQGAVAGNANTAAANNISQTLTSGGSALASIYGNQAQGVGNAVNGALNNYMYFNSLGPQMTGTGAYNTTGTVNAPSGQQLYQNAPVAGGNGIVWG